MNEAETSQSMSMGLARVMDRARKDPHGKMRSLAHHIDIEALERAYERIRKDAAVGVDGVTREEYGSRLEENLKDLHARLKAMKYRHQPIRRVHIPKDRGRTRPIGVSTTEDKIVQGALRELLEAVYEQEFLDCSFGFRPGRSAHDALLALNRSVRYGEANWILEADIESFFDSVDRSALSRMLEERIDDKSLMRLIGKWHPAWKTRKKSLCKAIRAIQSWCKANRHLSIPEQHAALTRRIQGHFNYFGVNGNQRCLSMMVRKTSRSWFRWLRRRSQRTLMTWKRFNGILKDLPLPAVKVYRDLWAGS